MKAPGTADYSDVTVAMITRNEEEAIRKVVRDARAALPGAAVVVVDGSTDETPRRAEEEGAQVIREPGGGPAPALLCALRASDRPIVVTVDADDTYPASVYPRLVDLIRSGYDVAGTDRLGRRPPDTMPFPNWIANKLFAGVASVRTRHLLRDPHSGQRAYRRAIIDEFDWDTSGLAFPVDLLLWPAYAGFRVTEIPIEYRERIGQTTLGRWASGKQTLRRLARPGRQIGKKTG